MIRAKYFCLALITSIVFKQPYFHKCKYHKTQYITTDETKDNYFYCFNNNFSAYC